MDSSAHRGDDAGDMVQGVDSTFAAWSASVARYHDQIAVLDAAGSSTYAEVDVRARLIAEAVRQHSSDRRPLAVVASKSVWTVAAMFSPLYSGSATLLLDPDEPDERWAGVARRAEVGLVLCTPDGRRPAPGTFGPDVEILTSDDLPTTAVDARANSLAPDDDVWLIATSGSTGVPKIVSATDRGSAQAWARQVRMGSAESLGPGDVTLVLAPLAFLAARGPLFFALASGAAARLVDNPRTPPARLLDLVDAEGVRTLSTNPWHLRALVDAAVEAGRQLPIVQKIAVSGGPVTNDDVLATWRAFPNARVRVVYGSSEVPHLAEAVLAPGDALEPGTPISYDVFADVALRVVDDEGDDVADHIIGQVLVRGPEMASGYIADDALNARALHIDADGLTWFRTGDLGRLRPDGRLEVHGRDDARVKVNGLAVDLIVVNRALAALPGVADAEVASVADGDRTHLVAWVVPAPDAELSVRSLRGSLAESLPEYMVPRVFRSLTAIPRTTRGKVDRMALRAAAALEVPLGVVDEAPASDIERRVAALVGAVLERDEIGRHGGFFELGGDSLGALELLVSLTAAFTVPDAVRPLLEEVVLRDGSVADLAAVLGDTDGALGGRAGMGLRPDGLTVMRLAGPDPTVDDGLPTVVVVPGGGLGGLLELRGLARRLRAWPVLGFDPPGSHDGHRPDPTSRHTAARIVEALRELDPAGPFLVVGYSIGGLTAYDVATRLMAAGAPVTGLVLVDSPRPGTTPRVTPKGLVASVRRRASLARRRVLRETLPVVAWTGDRRELAADGQARILARRFDPAPFSGRTLIVRSDTRRARHHPSDLGWLGLLTGEPTTLDARGTHKTILVPPGVDAIAEAILRLGTDP